MHPRAILKIQYFIDCCAWYFILSLELPVEVLCVCVCVLYLYRWPSGFISKVYFKMYLSSSTCCCSVKVLLLLLYILWSVGELFFTQTYSQNRKRPFFSDSKLNEKNCLIFIYYCFEFFSLCLCCARLHLLFDWTAYVVELQHPKQQAIKYMYCT